MGLPPWRTLAFLLQTWQQQGLCFHFWPFIITSHPQPLGLQPSVNALFFQHFKPPSPKLYLRTQPCVSQFHPPKKEMRNKPSGDLLLLCLTVSQAPVSSTTSSVLTDSPFTRQPLQGCPSLLSPYFLTYRWSPHTRIRAPALGCFSPAALSACIEQGRQHRFLPTLFWMNTWWVMFS